MNRIIGIHLAAACLLAALTRGDKKKSKSIKKTHKRQAMLGGRHWSTRKQQRLVLLLSSSSSRKGFEGVKKEGGVGGKRKKCFGSETPKTMALQHLFVEGTCTIINHAAVSNSN
jgi:hypothetical protein